jgi:hypothetical protein
MKSFRHILIGVLICASFSSALYAQTNNGSKSTAEYCTKTSNVSHFTISNGKASCNDQGRLLWLHPKGVNKEEYTLSKASDPIAEINRIYGNALKGNVNSYKINVDALVKFLRKDEPDGVRASTYTYGSNPNLPQELQLDTLITKAANQYIRVDGNGKVESKTFIDDGTYKVENGQGVKQEKKGADEASYMLAVIDENRLPTEYRTPAPYNLDLIKDGETPPKAYKDFFAYKILIPGIDRCWKKNATGKGSRMMVPTDNSEWQQMCYQPSYVAVLPPALTPAQRANDPITIVLGRSYIGQSPEDREEPEVIATWQLTMKDLRSAKYVVATTGISETDPGVIVGLISNVK